MHLILFNIILLLLLPNPTLQVRVTFTNAHQIPHSQHWAAQACSNVLITECCAPLNLNVPGIGDRWFRATTAHFTHLPPVSLYLSLWRGQGAGYVCRGATLGDEITDGKPNLKYIDTSGFGLGGAWFTQWVSHENKTGVAATPQLVYPDEILYLGALYKEVSEASGIFRNAAGIFIYGLPFGTSILTFHAIQARPPF